MLSIAFFYCYTLNRNKTNVPSKSCTAEVVVRYL